MFELYNCIYILLTIHLALVTQDDLPPATRRIDGQGLLETLFNLRSPDSFRILSARLLVVIKLAGVKLGDLLTNGLTDSGQADSVVTLQQIKYFQLPASKILYNQK